MVLADFSVALGSCLGDHHWSVPLYRVRFSSVRVIPQQEPGKKRASEHRREAAIKGWSQSSRRWRVPSELTCGDGEPGAKAKHEWRFVMLMRRRMEVHRESGLE